MTTALDIIANCQGGPLAEMLSAADGVEAFHHPIHLLGFDDVARDRAENADVVVAQVFGDGTCPELRAETIRSTFRNVVLVPNIHFEAVFGEPCFVKTAAGALVSDMPSTFHYLPVFEAWRRGDTVEALASLTDLDFYSSADAARLWDRSMKALARREAHADLIISDRIAERCATGDGFFALNHPKEALIRDLAVRIADRVGLAGVGSVATPLGYERLPTNPSIAHHLGLTAPEPYLGGVINHGGPDGIAFHTYDLIGSVGAYFAAYDAWSATGELWASIPGEKSRPSLAA